MRSHRQRHFGTGLIWVEIHDIPANSSFRPHRHYPWPFVIISSIPRFRKPRRLHQATTLIWNDVTTSRLSHFHPTQATTHIHRLTQFGEYVCLSIFNLLCNLFFIYFLQFFLTIKGKKLVLGGAIRVIGCIIVKHLWARLFDYIQFLIATISNESSSIIESLSFFLSSLVVFIVDFLTNTSLSN